MKLPIQSTHIYLQNPYLFIMTLELLCSVCHKQLINSYGKHIMTSQRSLWCMAGMTTVLTISLVWCWVLDTATTSDDKRKDKHQPQPLAGKKRKAECME
jgi:hypothetical protein